jgi:hypothetical protein
MTMDDQIIEVCIRKPLRRPAPRNDISVYTLLELRRVLQVPRTATLCVHDAAGDCASLGPAK